MDENILHLTSVKIDHPKIAKIRLLVEVSKSKFMNRLTES